MKKIIFNTIFVTILLSLSNSYCLADGPQGFGLITKQAKTYSINSEKSVVIKDKLDVQNYSDQETAVEIYGSDAKTTVYGTTSFTDKKEPQLTIGLWTKQQELILPPSLTKEIPYEISIPENTPPGEYYGAVIISTIPLKTEAQGTGVVAKSRYAQKIIINVSGEKSTNFNLKSFYTDYSSKNHNLKTYLETENLGNTVVKGDGKIKIIDSSGQTIKEYSLNNLYLYPGKSNKIFYEWDNTPLFGTYQVELDFNAYEFSLKNKQSKLIQEYKKTLKVEFFDIQTVLLAILGLLLIILMIGLITYKKKLAIKNSFLYTVKNDDTLESLSRKFSVDWKKIVKLNKLNAPYFINVGKELRIPQNKINAPKKG